MYQNDDDNTVAAMDLLLPFIGEIIGGSQREHRLDKLMQAMRFHNIDLQQMQWYIDTRKFGSVPHSGFGLGLERLPKSSPEWKYKRCNSFSKDSLKCSILK